MEEEWYSFFLVICLRRENIFPKALNILPLTYHWPALGDLPIPKPLTDKGNRIPIFGLLYSLGMKRIRGIKHCGQYVPKTILL